LAPVPRPEPNFEERKAPPVPRQDDLSEAPIWQAPGNVTIEKRPAPASGMAAPQSESQQKPAKPAQTFVPAPPASARRTVRRMPNVEELPLVAQNEIKAQAGEAPPRGLAAQKKKVGFLERLTHVRLGRKEVEKPVEAKREPEFGQPRALSASAMPSSVPAPKGPKTARLRGEGAPPGPKRMSSPPRVVSVEPRGAVLESVEEDDLEIPAFLRRRAN
jgi:cell division protein FtsZ